MPFPILSSILLTPVAGLLAVLSIPGERKDLIRRASLITASLLLAQTLFLLMRFDVRSGAMQFTERIPWLPAMGIDYALGVDGLSITMVLLTSIVIFCGVITSWTIEVRPKAFYANLLCLVTGVYGVFLSTNLFFFFLFYELAVLPMYLLILLWGSTRKEHASMKLTLYLLLGSTLIFAGFLALYAMPHGGTFDLLALQSRLVIDPSVQRLLYPMFFFGFGVLAGCFPFHVWSPEGHVAAPTAASMLHAGVLMKLGAFGILRVAVFLCPQGARDWALITASLALCNILYGAMVATQQKDLKFMIGFSSVSHMGIVLLGISCLNEAGINGAIFQMFSHGIMTALFFACVGYVYDNCHTRQMDELGGLSRRAPVISALFITAGLVGLGLPGFSGFIAEVWVTIGAVSAYPAIGIASILGLLITAYYILAAMQKTFYGPANPRHDHLTDVGAWQLFPRAVLVCTLLFFGLFPGIFFNWIGASTRLLAAGVLPVLGS
ncbi:MAG: NADH-quinone oxidoreductase subunit M [Candidatus Omnitrophica bacterium]|nr:NADH-quinone oxidoreductase subunit M [Candidatus Omnitrophota bacterium]